MRARPGLHSAHVWLRLCMHACRSAQYIHTPLLTRIEQHDAYDLMGL